MRGVERSIPQHVPSEIDHVAGPNLLHRVLRLHRLAHKQKQLGLRLACFAFEEGGHGKNQASRLLLC